ncbi:MAG: amidohydrolase [Chloroflexi bacterium]|nr:amidohydrolase [Chloroflexota bacterium]
MEQIELGTTLLAAETITVAEMKARACAAIDVRRQEIVALAEAIFANPELGFKEVQTARRVAQTFARLGIPFREGLAVTGVKGILHGGVAGPSVAVMGELDSLAVAGHFQADPQTGAAHACGHNAQIAALIATGIGLQAPGILAGLAGTVVLFAVPAEEYVEIEYRLDLRRSGAVEFLAGKTELVRLGELDDVQMAMMVHTTSNPEDRQFRLDTSSNGCIAKQIRFVGKAAHAGGAPHRGVNALNAAHLAIAAIHAQRETFRDEDSVRVHPIITRGGELVNVVPSDVRMETFVRGRTVAAIEEANVKVDRALRAGALAVGARVQITTMPGYLPLNQDPALTGLFRRNAVSLAGEENVTAGGHRGGSTDMGDISHIMPAIHPYAGGATGTGHGADYRIVDYDRAVINPAKAMAMTVVDLLAEGGAGARRVLDLARPPMTRAQYLAFVRGLAGEREYAEE